MEEFLNLFKSGPALLLLSCSILIGLFSPAILFRSKFKKSTKRNNEKYPRFLTIYSLLGKKIFFLIMLLESITTFFLMFTAIYFLHSILISALVAIIIMAAHSFSILHPLRGGSGTGPIIGILLACSPWTLIICLTFFLLIYIFTKQIEHAEILTIAIMPSFSIIVSDGDLIFILMTTILSMISIKKRWYLIKEIFDHKKKSLS
tara:strand:+ start:1446 stop:2057 length:612 start_codon:yes stop_codon:yes gene_type:complete